LASSTELLTIMAKNAANHIVYGKFDKGTRGRYANEL
jgi:hypothetical protein